MNPYLKQSGIFNNDVSQYFTDGFWTSNKFLNGMYLRVEDHPKEKDKKTNKKLKRAYFRGIIATSKLYVPDKKIKNKEGDPEKRKSKFVTFITLGISDTKWIDVVAWGGRKLSKIHCLEGYGFWEDDSWIRVEHMGMSKIE